MTITNKTIAIYSNLPSGGGANTLLSISNYLRDKYKIISIVEPRYQIHNLLEYLYVGLFKSPSYQKNAISNMTYDILIAFQSWLVKSPNILRYSNKHTIYICHEPPREFYDIGHINSQSLKEKLVNVVRLPFKWMDRINASAANTLFIVNSKSSKQLIDSIYKVNSIVVYPGVKTSHYIPEQEIIKEDKVICIGAINILKRQDFLIEVLSKIPITRRPMIVLVANGADKRYLDMIIRRANDLKVTLKVKMNISESEKLEVLHTSKLFLYAPINEPFGLVVEEAVASGLPIVVYADGGGYTEVISSQNGIIIDNLDAEYWASQIDALLRDEKRIIKFSKYNTRYAKKYLDDIISNRKIASLVESRI